MLHKIDTRNIPENSAEIRLICKIRDEATRLPYWFSYHRGLGVSRFFFIDDHSTDGTREYLLAQPDTHVFQADNSFRDANGGVEWQNELLDRYATGQWSVVVDADELFAYEKCDMVKLPDFCAMLDREGADMLFAFMLDFYADNIEHAVCEPGKPFQEICPLFDGDYAFIKRFQLLAKRGFEYPGTDVLGGVRMRLFYPEQRDPCLYNRLRNRLLWRICDVMEKMGVKFSDKPHHAPTLYKVPLVKWQKGYRRLSSHHVTKPGKGFSAHTGVLMHFKFFADFHNKLVKAVESGQYYSGNREYKHYMHSLRTQSHFSFLYEGSRKYEGVHSLSGFFNVPVME